jgi:hypothetical protein
MFRKTEIAIILVAITVIIHAVGLAVLLKVLMACSTSRFYLHPQTLDHFARFAAGRADDGFGHAGRNAPAREAAAVSSSTDSECVNRLSQRTST